MEVQDGIELTEREDTQTDAAVAALREAGVTAQELFGTLERPGNRYVLTYVLESSEPVTWYDLVEYVVEETEPPMDLTPTEYRGRIATHLLHERLPELAERSFIEYRPGEHRVQAGEGLPALRPYLEIVDEQGL